MHKKIIKITEAQFEEIKKVLAEAPFSYLGNDTTDTNDNSQVFANTPPGSLSCEPENTTGDDASSTMATRAWWNRRI